MDNQEFATWDKHKAENLLSQRDDTLKQIATANATILRLKAENAKLDARIEGQMVQIGDLSAQLAEANRQIEKLTRH